MATTVDNFWTTNFDSKGNPLDPACNAWEVQGSQKTSFGLDAVECSVDLQCAWGDRHTLAMHLMGMLAAYTNNYSLVVPNSFEEVLYDEDGNEIPPPADPTDPNNITNFTPKTWPYMSDLAQKAVNGAAKAKASDLTLWNFGDPQFANQPPNTTPTAGIDQVTGAIYYNHPPVCYSVAIAPVPGKQTVRAIDGSVMYELATVSAKFSTNQEQELKSEEIEFHADFQRIRPTGLFWRGDGTDSQKRPLTNDEAPGRLTHGATIHRTLYRQAKIKPSLQQLEGYVNIAAWNSQILGLTFGPETLLFQPATCKRTIGLNGDEAWNISLRFEYKQQTWNKFWRQGSALGGRYEYMYSEDSGPYPYVDGSGTGGDTPFKPYLPADFKTDWLY